MEIVIVTGFLGGGKTSTLNFLIQDTLDQNLKPAVIMNDFGERNVDQHFIHEPIHIKAMTNGCICCTFKKDVAAQLHEIYLEHQPDIIFIECSGLAHPLEVYDTCLTPVLTPLIERVRMIGVIDASVYYQKEDYPEDIQTLIKEQTQFCSHLILNKIELMETEALLNVVKRLEIDYPEIPYLLTQHGEVTLAEMPEQTVIAKEERPKTHGALTQCFHEFNKPIKQSALIEGLKQLEGHVYRVKGFLELEGMDQPCIMQYVPGHLELKPCQLDMPSYLVVIGYELCPTRVNNTFDDIEFAS
ncbi:CobW family GTP-binding protein [Staphylococcus chromogenes]|uniref:CobW family GTP-binding protein n=1 Tax=Staphylococcus chromogenes TaxID=46126 RepID=UPI000D1AB2F0|nr:GTP-binding protein [Staphylococcus chromogenes]PTG70921.1 GTP-binding protein [Staphylococcus chromogenes]